MTGPGVSPTAVGQGRWLGGVGSAVRRPLRHLVVALSPWPLTSLLAARARPLMFMLVLAGSAVGVVVGVLLRVRLVQARRGRERLMGPVGQAGLEHAECALERVYADWLELEAARGLRELECWRRTRSS